ETEYDDFELRLEYQLTKGADSGVALRTAPTGAPYNSGMEIQLVDESSFPRIKPEQTTGAIWDVKAPAQKAAKPLGEWNELHVTLQDRKLQVVLNGTT